MNQPYIKKDLGYKRTPTEARLRVTFENGDVFDVPAQVVADSRDENYRHEQEDTVGFIRRKSLRRYDLSDWAVSNMNWSDVEPYAVKVELPRKEFNYERNWNGAERSIEGSI